jgi:hypothetical protein
MILTTSSSKAGPTPHTRATRSRDKSRKVPGKRKRWKNCCKYTARKRDPKRIGIAQRYPTRGWRHLGRLLISRLCKRMICPVPVRFCWRTTPSGHSVGVVLIIFLLTSLKEQTVTAFASLLRTEDDKRPCWPTEVSLLSHIWQSDGQLLESASIWDTLAFKPVNTQTGSFLGIKDVSYNVTILR